MAANKRKYLVSLIPFVVCTGLSVTYSLLDPKNYPDPSYPFKTKEVLDYLSQGWLLIGIVLSGVFFSIILIDDVFRYLEGLYDQRRLRK
jgi:hypothetical protein